MAYNPISPALVEPKRVTTTVFDTAHATNTISIRRKATGTAPAGSPTLISTTFAAAPVGKLRLHVMGDSLTQDLPAYYSAGGCTPFQLQNLFTTARATVVNNGIATQTLADMDARFNADVLAYYNNTTHPRHVVVIAGGDNDLNAGRTVAQAIASTNAMITRAIAGGFRVVVVLMHVPQYVAANGIPPFVTDYHAYYNNATNKANLGYDEVVDLLLDYIARYDDTAITDPIMRQYWTNASGTEDRQHFGPPLAARRAVLIAAAVEKVNLLAALPAPPAASAEFITDNEFDLPFARNAANGFATNGAWTNAAGKMVCNPLLGDVAYTQVGGLTVGQPYTFRIQITTLPAGSAIGVQLGDINGQGQMDYITPGSYLINFTATTVGGNIYINGGGGGAVAIERVSLLHT